MTELQMVVSDRVTETIREVKDRITVSEIKTTKVIRTLPQEDSETTNPRITTIIQTAGSEIILRGIPIQMAALETIRKTEANRTAIPPEVAEDLDKTIINKKRTANTVRFLY